MILNKKLLAVAFMLGVVTVPLALKRSRAVAGLEVDMARVSEQEIRPTILASGTLAYRTEVSLTAELVAKVSMITVKEGDTVMQGQLLMKLDPETYRNVIEQEEASRRQSSISIERQRAALTLREKQFERSKKLVDAKIIDLNAFDEARNQLELARVDVRSSEEALRRADAVLSQAHEQLAKTEIRSPIAGRVVDLPIKVGETAIPSTSSLAGARLMKIADTSTIQAELKVDEADIAMITVGQQADVFAAAYPDTALKGKVEQIALAPTVEGQGRAYKVTVVMSTPKNVELRSGMSARADIFLSDGKKRLSVPLEAVGTDVSGNKKVTSYVWLQKNGKAAKVEVETGMSDDQWEEVGKPITVGDVVVVGPAKTLRMLHEGDPLTQRPKHRKDDTREDSAGEGVEE